MILHRLPWLMALLCVVAPALAADVGENCPLVNRTYSAALVEKEVTGTVGEEILLRFTLDPPEAPPGFFVVVNAKVLEAPEGVSPKELDILTGFPETGVTALTPGRWKVGVVVSLMAKGSCGGLTAATALNDSAVVVAKPAD